jgi:hypothetical protein
MPNNNICRWCGMRRIIGFHSLCKTWYIFRIKDYIDNGTMIEQFPNRFNSEYKFSRNDGKAIEYSITMNKLYNKGISLEWFPCIDTMVNILNQI